MGLIREFMQDQAVLNAQIAQLTVLAEQGAGPRRTATYTVGSDGQGGGPRRTGTYTVASNEATEEMNQTQWLDVSQPPTALGADVGSRVAGETNVVVSVQPPLQVPSTADGATQTEDTLAVTAHAPVVVAAAADETELRNFDDIEQLVDENGRLEENLSVALDQCSDMREQNSGLEAAIDALKEDHRAELSRIRDVQLNLQKQINEWSTAGQQYKLAVKAERVLLQEKVSSAAKAKLAADDRPDSTARERGKRRASQRTLPSTEHMKRSAKPRARMPKMVCNTLRLH